MLVCKIYIDTYQEWFINIQPRSNKIMSGNIGAVPVIRGNISEH